MIDLSLARGIVDMAEPNPDHWSISGGGDQLVIFNDGTKYRTNYAGEDNSYQDAQFISYFNPVKVNEMLEEIASLRSKVRWAEENVHLEQIKHERYRALVQTDLAEKSWRQETERLKVQIKDYHDVVCWYAVYAEAELIDTFIKVDKRKMAKELLDKYRSKIKETT